MGRSEHDTPTHWPDLPELLDAHSGPVRTGSGANVDIVVASARAYISALNKMIGWMSVAQKVAPKGRATASVDSGAGPSNGAAKDEAPPALSVSM